jgi:hypothetical protein
MTDIQDLEEWKLGRRGEILADIVLARHGFTLLDAAGSGTRATTLHRYQADLVAPDYLGIMTRPLWFEIKTKRQDWIWRGGGRDDSGNRMPPGRAQGIDRRAYENYRKAQRPGMPVVLLIIIIPTGEMIANSLEALGTPYPSVRDDIAMVNWPTSRFLPLYTFDPYELDRYFYDPPLSGSPFKRVRRPPLHMPAQHLRQLVFDRLQPVQQELMGFRQHLFECVNNRWTA